jgi:WD40 repeat protein
LHPGLLAFSDDETRIIAGDESGIDIWNADTGVHIATIIEGEELWINAIAVAPNDTLLVCADDWVRRYDFSGNVVSTFPGSKGFHVACVSSDGRHAALIGNGNVTVFDLASGERTNSMLVGSASALAFSPDGRSLAVGDRDGNVSLFDVRTAEREWTTTPPGRYRWAWTLPAPFLVIWCLIVWRVLLAPPVAVRRPN